MAQIQPPQPEGDFGGYAEFHGEGAPGRRKLVRYGVPIAVAGVAAATIGLGTALATTGGGPSLPHLTAQQLVAKMAASKVQTVSGSVNVTTDLGLPSALVNSVAGSGMLGSSGSSAEHSGHSAQSGQKTSSADPRTKLTELLSGSHTLRVAADGPDRQRFSLVDNGSQYTVVRDSGQLWAYDSASNSVYHSTEPAAAKGTHADHGTGAMPATPADAAQQALKAVGPTTSVTVGGTAEVAGRDAYQLVIKPKQSGSTVGAIRIAVDAATGAPLSFTLSPAGGGAPVVDIAYTKVDFGKPAASQFAFTVPKGAHVTQATPDKGATDRAKADHAKAGHGRTGMTGRPGFGVNGMGWTAVAELKAPAGHGAAGTELGGNDAMGLIGSFGKPVKGSFGSGTVISTRIVNVLVTRDGAVYAGAVTPATLVKDADAAAK